MPGSSLLSLADLDALVAFVATLAPKEEEPSTLTEELQRLLRMQGFTPESEPRSAVALTLCDLEGREYSLARERGRWVLLNFWSVTCTHCFEELPHLERLAESLRTEGLTVLAICTDAENPNELAALVRKHTRKLPVYFDPSSRAAQHYDVQVTPSSYLVDPLGRLVARARGAHPWSAADTQHRFRALLKAPGTAPAGGQ